MARARSATTTEPTRPPCDGRLPLPWWRGAPRCWYSIARYRSMRQPISWRLNLPLARSSASATSCMPVMRWTGWSYGRCLSRLAPQALARRVEFREVQAQVELILVIIRFHVGAQLVEGLVVLLLLDVRQLV